MKKYFRIILLTSKRRAEHPFSGRNTQQTIICALYNKMQDNLFCCNRSTVAQIAEWVTTNPEVPGSSPCSGSYKTTSIKMNIAWSCDDNTRCSISTVAARSSVQCTQMRWGEIAQMVKRLLLIRRTWVRIQSTPCCSVPYPIVVYETPSHMVSDCADSWKE